MRFVIYGAGGFGREVAPLARACLDEHPDGAANSVVFVDDAAERPEECNGYPVIGFDHLTPSDQIIIAVGNGWARQKIEQRCVAAGLVVTGISAPTVRKLDQNELWPDAVLCDYVTITSNVKIGRGFQAHNYSYVAHDCVIGDYVTLAPRASLNGNIHVGDHAYIGAGAVFVQGKEGNPLRIGEGAVVGMGAVVTKPVNPYAMVVGNPAKVIRTLSKPFESDREIGSVTCKFR
jgi:sugar O-acyltransferase (sialic acid O-acetyltransferase NeuD family)